MICVIICLGNQLELPPLLLPVEADPPDKVPDPPELELDVDSPSDPLVDSKPTSKYNPEESFPNVTFAFFPVPFFLLQIGRAHV